MSEMERFIYTESKPLPVILLLDTSKSMAKNNNIGTLNEAVNQMLRSFKTSAGNEASIQIAVIVFGENTELLMPLRDVNCVETIKPFVAKGGTFMAKAIDIAKDLIEDRELIPSRCYRPIVLMVTDGAPGDNWRAAMDRFIHHGRSSKCYRMAMGIGNGSSGIAREVLETFISPGETVYSAANANEISQFFTYATMTAQKSISHPVAAQEKPRVELQGKPIKDDEEDQFLEELIIL